MSRGIGIDTILCMAIVAIYNAHELHVLVLCIPSGPLAHSLPALPQDEPGVSNGGSAVMSPTKRRDKRPKLQRSPMKVTMKAGHRIKGARLQDPRLLGHGLPDAASQYWENPFAT